MHISPKIEDGGLAMLDATEEVAQIDNNPEENACDENSAEGERGEKLPVRRNVDVDLAPVPKQKQTRSIVDSVHLNTLLSVYHYHFAAYRRNRAKQVTQLIPGKVWKLVYLHYRTAFPKSPFQEETLKDRLREALKELKTETYNDEYGDKLALQGQETLLRLTGTVNATDGHANRNILKRKHSGVDGISPLVCPCTANIADPLVSSQFPTTPVAACDKQANLTQNLTQIMNSQASSLSSMVVRYQTSSDARERLIEAKLKLTEHKNNLQQIINLQKAMELGVITHEEFKDRVRNILSL